MTYLTIYLNCLIFQDQVIIKIYQSLLVSQKANDYLLDLLSPGFPPIAPTLLPIYLPKNIPILLFYQVK